MPFLKNLKFLKIKVVKNAPFLKIPNPRWMGNTARQSSLTLRYAEKREKGIRDRCDLPLRVTSVGIADPVVRNAADATLRPPLMLRIRGSYCDTRVSCPRTVHRTLPRVP